MKNIVLIGILSFLSFSSFAMECKIGNLQLDTSQSVPSSNAKDELKIIGQKVVAYTKANVDVGVLLSSQTVVPIAKSDIVAYEYVFKKPNNLVNAEVAGGWIAGTSNFNGTIILASSIVGANTIHTTVSGHVTPNTSTSEVLNSETIRVGLYFNQVTKKIGYIVNNINKGYIWNYSEPLSDLKFDIVTEFGFFSASSPNLGKEISFEIISDHSKLQFAYPSGTTDICGNTI